MAHIITFTFENRKIVSGEYGASFGSNVLIRDIVLSKNYLPLSKTMVLTSTETSARIECQHVQRLGSKLCEALYYLSTKGIIKDLSY